jgi:hypothetical protein
LKGLGKSQWGEEWHQKGEQNTLRPDTLIPSPQPSTKLGQVHLGSTPLRSRAGANFHNPTDAPTAPSIAVDPR